MQKISLVLITVLFFLCDLNDVHSQVVLPSVFSDHMVLQRNADVNIWGWGRRGSEVRIMPSWSKDTIRVNCDGYSKWNTTLKTPDAGGPYEIKFVNGRSTSYLKDILMGEVWLCSGQSNMEWGAHNKLQEMLDELPKASNANIRLLHVNRIAAETPQNNFENKWELANKERLQEFSAIGYFLAQKLHKELGVPIGIISASWGGTNAEVWVPEQYIAADEILSADAKTFAPHRSRPSGTGALWNSMLNPLKGFSLAGFCWYQGENNVSNYGNYKRLMSTLIRSWRSEWKAQLPFYYVQIAPHPYKQSTPTEQKAALLREQQMNLLDQQKTGMVVVSDLVPDVKNIHPPLKREVADRLANIALAEVYGQALKDYKSPVYKTHKIKGNEVIVEFDYVENGLLIKDGNSVKELYIAGENKIFQQADSRIEGNKLIISSKYIAHPKSVLFSFSDIAVSNLYSKSGLPVAPFRIGYEE